MNAKWVDELKVGDKIIDRDEIKTVTAIHKLHIVCGEYKYNKATGKKVGSCGWPTRYMSEATPDAISRIAVKRERSALIQKIFGQNYNRTSTETLRKIAAILDADQGVGK